MYNMPSKRKVATLSRKEMDFQDIHRWWLLDQWISQRMMNEVYGQRRRYKKTFENGSELGKNAPVGPQAVQISILGE